jgi:hypothetical protein
MMFNKVYEVEHVVLEIGKIYWIERRMEIDGAGGGCQELAFTFQY